MPEESRRSFLTAAGVASTFGLGGCLQLGEGGTTATSTSSDIQDTDGDGVIDSEDYAPRDPDVQRQEQVTGDSATQTDSPTESPTDSPTESPTDSPTPRSVASFSSSFDNGLSEWDLEPQNGVTVKRTRQPVADGTHALEFQFTEPGVGTTVLTTERVVEPGQTVTAVCRGEYLREQSANIIIGDKPPDTVEKSDTNIIKFAYNGWSGELFVSPNKARDSYDSTYATGVFDSSDWLKYIIEWEDTSTLLFEVRNLSTGQTTRKLQASQSEIDGGRHFLSLRFYHSPNAPSTGAAYWDHVRVE